ERVMVDENMCDGVSEGETPASYYCRAASARVKRAVLPAGGVDKTLHHARPGAREIPAVVAATAERQHTAVAQPIRQIHKLPGGPGVDLRRKAQVGDRVAFHAVSAALEDDELRLEALEVRNHLWPHACERGVVRAGRQRQVQLRATRSSATRLVGRAGARIKKPAVLVDVGEDDRRVFFERIEDAVAVMRVDI